MSPNTPVYRSHTHLGEMSVTEVFHHIFRSCITRQRYETF